MRVLSVVVVSSVLALITLPLVAAGKVSDDKIFDEVRIKLAEDPQVRGGGFKVEVGDGVVTLAGKVKTVRQKDRAERLTKKVKGVTKVVNKLIVEP
jgi:osmotically-inducible protein OsmY